MLMTPALNQWLTAAWDKEQLEDQDHEVKFNARAGCLTQVEDHDEVKFNTRCLRISLIRVDCDAVKLNSTKKSVIAIGDW